MIIQLLLLTLIIPSIQIAAAQFPENDSTSSDGEEFNKKQLQKKQKPHSNKLQKKELKAAKKQLATAEKEKDDAQNEMNNLQHIHQTNTRRYYDALETKNPQVITTATKYLECSLKNHQEAFKFIEAKCNNTRNKYFDALEQYTALQNKRSK